MRVAVVVVGRGEQAFAEDGGSEPHVPVPGSPRFLRRPTRRRRPLQYTAGMLSEHIFFSCCDVVVFF